MDKTESPFYLGPPTSARTSPYWPPGLPLDPEAAYGSYRDSLAPRDLERAVEVYGGIPALIKCECSPPHCLLGVLESLAARGGIPRSPARPCLTREAAAACLGDRTGGLLFFPLLLYGLVTDAGTAGEIQGMMDINEPWTRFLLEEVERVIPAAEERERLFSSWARCLPEDFPQYYREHVKDPKLRARVIEKAQMAKFWWPIP